MLADRLQASDLPLRGQVDMPDDILIKIRVHEKDFKINRLFRRSLANPAAIFAIEKGTPLKLYNILRGISS